MPLDVQINYTFNQLLVMIYSRTGIDKERFKLVLTCKSSLKSINKFQHCLIWDDNSVYRMLKLVDTTGIEKIELYVQLVQVKPQVNQSAGTYTNLLLGRNFNVEEFDYGCGPNSIPVDITDRFEVNEDD